MESTAFVNVTILYTAYCNTIYAAFTLHWVLQVSKQRFWSHGKMRIGYMETPCPFTKELEHSQSSVSKEESWIQFPSRVRGCLYIHGRFCFKYRVLWCLQILGSLLYLSDCLLSLLVCHNSALPSVLDFKRELRHSCFTLFDHWIDLENVGDFLSGVALPWLDEKFPYLGELVSLCKSACRCIYGQIHIHLYICQHWLKVICLPSLTAPNPKGVS